MDVSGNIGLALIITSIAGLSTGIFDPMAFLGPLFSLTLLD
jgi:hypothetical protein